MLKHKDDNYLFKLHRYYLEPYLKVLLSNGEVIFQDDYTQDEPFWTRIQRYSKQNNLYAIHMNLNYGDNCIDVIPTNSDGLFFRRGIIASMFVSTDPNIAPIPGARSKSFVIGWYDKSKEILHTHTYKLPELELHLIEARDINQMIQNRCFEGDSLWIQK